ncbi:hypothetical protein [Enterococcus faecalis]|uniref:Uncharacterized protein n=1 Tax=Enterococcus faecalis RP2S-4 TaxID=1244145 RepID=A0ABC9TN44_ENTFL|nr:hypothetical protein [Enterococcus faecalis]EPI10834.1 hypothetical protein D358_00562 [Enterococcus faecalis RP2S-4]
MADYEIQDKGLQGDTETTSAVATISYEIENAKYHGLTDKKINKQIEKLQESNKFPSNLEYVDSFYDSKTSLSGAAFKDVNTDYVTVGIAGTNLDNGLWEKAKDLKADADIAFKGPTATNPYFDKGNEFIADLKTKHPVEAITGHSKAGRDVVMLGVEQNIPAIVTYNAAPLKNDWVQLGSALTNPSLRKILGYGKNVLEQGEMQRKLNEYDGVIVNFATGKDLLTGLAGLGQSYYLGNINKLDKDGDHAVTNFLTKNMQKQISKILGKETRLGEITNTEMAVLVTNSKLQLVNELRGRLKGKYGSVSASQEQLLDMAQALIITRGHKEAIQTKLQTSKKRLEEEKDRAKQLWRETQEGSRRIGGSILSAGEEETALRQGGATKNRIEGEIVEACEAELRTYRSMEQQYNQYLEKVNRAIQNQVKTDQEMAGMLKGLI